MSESNFVVSARSFRPQTFAEVVGQEHVTRILQNAIQMGRVAHAYIFAGPRGVGKTSTARILAKALNCHASEGPTISPCQTCESCVSITKGTSVDVIEIDGASNRGIDEIRALRENARLRPVNSRYKVFTIDEVHMLTREAFNALLKTLEEPPPHIRFIMATTEEHKIPETVLSRCQVFRFRLMNSLDIVDHLKRVARSRNVEVDEQVFFAVARAASGSMRDSLSLFDQVLSLSDAKVTFEDAELVLGTVRYDVLVDLSAKMHAGNTAGILEIVHRVATAGKDMVQFTRDLIEHYRALLVARNVKKPEEVLILSDDEMGLLKELASQIPESEILTTVETLWAAESRMRFIPDVRSVLEMSLVKIAKLGRTVEIEDLLARLAGLEQALSTGGKVSIRLPEAPPEQKTVIQVAQSGSASVSPEPQKKAPAPAPVAPPLPEVPPPVEAAAVLPLEETKDETAVAVGYDEANSALLEAVRERWPEIVDGAPALLHGCLHHAYPVSVREGRVILGVLPNQTLSLSRLEKRETQETLAGIIEKLVGRRPRLECEVSDAVPKRPEPAVSSAREWDEETLKQQFPNLAGLLRAFNGKVIGVRSNGRQKS